MSAIGVVLKSIDANVSVAARVYGGKCWVELWDLSVNPLSADKAVGSDANTCPLDAESDHLLSARMEGNRVELLFTRPNGNTVTHSYELAAGAEVATYGAGKLGRPGLRVLGSAGWVDDFDAGSDI